MRLVRDLLLVCVVSSVFCGVGFAQTGSLTDAFYSITDGAITLEGNFQQLAGIETLSAGNHLSLESTTAPDVGRVLLKSPFPGDATVVQNESDHVTLGVLGQGNRINISGSTRTSILYAATQATAQGGDLIVNIGAGDCGPAPLLTTPVSLVCDRNNWRPSNTGGGNTGGGNTGGGNTGGGNTGGGNTGGGNTGGGNTGSGDQGVFQLIDGEIYLVGVFENLSGIEITSSDGNLSLGTVDTGVKGVAPFPNGAAIVENTPYRTVIGVLGADKRVRMEGETATSIRYAETLDFAKTDLTIDIGLNDSSPQAVTVGDRELPLGNTGVTIVDGVVTFLGTFDSLAGVQAISPAGHLSLDSVSIEGSTLFSAFESVVAVNDEGRISISTDRHVSLDGLTPTGIFFSGSAAAFANSDIQVLISLADNPPIALTEATVPEPSSSCLCLLGILGILCLRNKRCVT